MKKHFAQLLAIIMILFSTGCKKSTPAKAQGRQQSKNSIRHAKGLAIFKYDGYSVVRVSNPWPKATKDYTYILKQENGTVPDSLKQYTEISVPVKSIIVTSTTHIPSLEMLGVAHTLGGFPNTDYVSSKEVRRLIDAGKVRELGSNQSLNTEVVIDIAPDVIIGYGIDNNNTTLDNLQKSGLKVVLNGDWNEQSPLGKAEWIKLFGALYGLEAKAETIFTDIEHEYNAALQLAQKAGTRPAVLAGAMYENQWYLPQGDSWGASFIGQAGGNYLWHDSKGTGSLSLPFEAVLEKAEMADFWIGPGQFTSFREMSESNAHYSRFKAFKNKKVYSFSIRKGDKGGIVYFELAPNRPDLVLKDIIKILHPELLPEHELFFFQQLR